jgi:hypothetical protein
VETSHQLIHLNVNIGQDVISIIEAGEELDKFDIGVVSHMGSDVAGNLLAQDCRVLHQKVIEVSSRTGITLQKETVGFKRRTCIEFLDEVGSMLTKNIRMSFKEDVDFSKEVSRDLASLEVGMELAVTGSCQRLELEDGTSLSVDEATMGLGE